MTKPYRRLAVFVDNPAPRHFLWIVIESTEDPAVWLDLETGAETYESWLEANTAGSAALLSYVEDDKVGPVQKGSLDSGQGGSPRN